jgi:hypothetical protein
MVGSVNVAYNMAVKFLWLLAAPVSIKVSPQIMGIIMTI